MSLEYFIKSVLKDVSIFKVKVISGIYVSYTLFFVLNNYIIYL